MIFNPLLAYKAVLEQKEFKLISQYINQNYGIKLPDHKRIMLQGRLINRLIKLNFTSFKEYTNYVFSEQGKLTEFFREAVHLKFLKDIIIPEFMSTPKSQPMRIWSAACSSGEEPYSIAMAANDVINTNSRFDFTIFGTDISNRMLEKAQKAIYPLKSTIIIPLETKKKYLLKSKDSGKNEVRIKKELRDKLSFMWHNLMDKEYEINQEFDVIFCRNVLIYFSKEDQMQVLQNLIKKLKPYGYLFLGHSESITNMNLPLENVSQTVFKKIIRS
jgi:chemotaxis protein methyltransferase CheR